jgi:hypothetical protein
VHIISYHIHIHIRGKAERERIRQDLSISVQFGVLPTDGWIGWMDWMDGWVIGRREGGLKA